MRDVLHMTFVKYMFTCYHFFQSALAGWVAGVAFVLWISIGSMIYSTNQDSLPVPTAKCPNTTLMYKYVSSSLISSYLCCENNSLFNGTYYIGNQKQYKDNNLLCCIYLFLIVQQY